MADGANASPGQCLMRRLIKDLKNVYPGRLIDQHCLQDQFSIFNAGTRLNSFVLFVTSTPCLLSAVPAIMTSYGPIVVPFLSKCTRIAADAFASSFLALQEN